jgi:phospho-N-acetylmuramoyl-pentapeptide-transferase
MRIFAIEPNQFFVAFIFVVVAFIASVLATPVLTDFLYKNKIGKRIRDTDHEGQKTPIFSKLHSHKENTPVMGGVLIWGVAMIITLVANFSRQTVLPLFTAVASGVIGGIDDLMNVFGIGASRGGMRFYVKFISYLIIAALGAFWFAYKLEWIHRGFYLPGLGDVILGYWYVPIFILVLIFIGFAANQTDGLDGLAGGTFAIGFGAYTLIGLFRGNYPLAVFCATVLGTTLAFLWFNIYPARFFMGDTGSMCLGMTLGVIAFLTNTVYLLPFIGFVPMVEAITTIIQILSKRIFKRKVFLVAPVHHHFEALGWPETKVTMRFWIISALTTVIGLSLALILG